ncbi:MAG TPA: AmmeMemoRadiSam system protein A [Candidatus Binatia bacterium]|nr:AmmeMemoRadiSam system protein A [Candidatus Binatia bacterium]
MSGVHLPIESQQRLMAIARHTLESVVRRHPLVTPGVDDPHLHEAYGAFVTLFNQRELRGCIGNCAPERPLFETVMEMTEAAATRDRRMRPVRPEELERIRIDISVLSPLERSGNPLALEVGRHGLHVAREGRRAVFLPQVAVEYGWDIKTFLEQACLKANLPKDAWSWPDTVVSSFTALVIEEER